MVRDLLRLSMQCGDVTHNSEPACEFRVSHLIEGHTKENRNEPLYSSQIEPIAFPFMKPEHQTYSSAVSLSCSIL